ncbi:MAG: potassium transporter TrkA [Chlorobi bacterium]|nr:potassium transporter TrkA [Chlorobiota bacterium]
MKEYLEIILLVLGFGILLISSNRLAAFFTRIKLPLITGLIIMGILIGPYVFDFLSAEDIDRLQFINEFALVFIAFAAGAELHLSEFRERMKSIVWITASQFLVVFTVGSIVFYLISGVIGFTRELPLAARIAISLFTGVISIARSPASTIAVINELRARGPFSRTALGVTIVIDVITIILFGIVFSFTNVLIEGNHFNYLVLLKLLLELLTAFLTGLFLGKILIWIMSLRIPLWSKITLVLSIGFVTYLLSHYLRIFSKKKLGFDFYVEPLLINIIASFFLTNYSRYRREFNTLLEKAMPYIYAAFFTLIGASISFEILIRTWTLAFLLFGLRLLLLVAGSWLGGTLAGEPARYNRIIWMPFITQAGVSLGLITVIMSLGFEWSYEFGMILIGTIILNQIAGPPLFKWAIHIVREHHLKGQHEYVSNDHLALIFGHEAQSLVLARQLSEQGWMVKLVTSREGFSNPEISNVTLVTMQEITKEALDNIEAGQAEAMVTMKTDEENYTICELAYEHYGTPNLVVRLNDRRNFNKFHELGALIVEPSTAIVSLLDHLVRAPNATSLLLGHEEKQDTVDIVLRNRNLHGIPLRNLDLPADILILSTRRRGQIIISTGFTRLRLGDTLTVVGSKESIEQLRLKLE